MSRSTLVPASADFCALLAGARVPWVALGMTPGEFLDECARHEVLALMHARSVGLREGERWPDAVCDRLAEFARAETARELVRGVAVARALEALEDAGVRAIVLKGTALAYTAYNTPIGRPRVDTDLLIQDSDVPAARAALAGHGYTAPPYCDDLFSQFQMERTDELGLRHVLDVHWKISSQPVFAEVLTHAEVLSRAVRVPALGSAARAPSAVDSLLLACIHPVMHHQNVERVLWIYDIHLLASTLETSEIQEFVRLARERRVASICGHSLALARAAFQTAIPAGALEALSRPEAPEPSAAYLASERRWHDELASSLRALPRFADRVKLMREVLLPGPSYMLGAYGLRDKPLAPWLLPALYVHRNVRGAWKILTGKK